MASKREQALQMVAAAASMQETKTAKRNRLKAEREAREAAEHAAAEAARDPRKMTQLEHRLKHDQHVVGGQEKGGVTSVQIINTLRIDILLADKVINEMQHLYGKQVITLWHIAQRPFMGAMNYDSTGREQEAPPGMLEDINLTRMDGATQFYKTMLYLAFARIDAMREAGKAYFDAKRANDAIGMRQAQKKMRYIYAARRKEHDLIVKICFEEKAAIQAAQELGFGINSATAKVRDAFDRLGESLVKMRTVKKEIAEASERAAQVKNKYPIRNAAETLSEA
jgi:hypothetical protein